MLQFLNAIGEIESKLSVGIAGGGEEFELLYKQIQDVRHKTLDVRLLGNLSSVEKETFMQSTKVFVFPSLMINDDVEGLPVALLEALATNKIVVASRATNIEQMPEWEHIKCNVLLLKDPTNPFEFATILSSALQKEPKDISPHMKRYEWLNLITEYIKLLNC